ncbi:unnamed protein product [Rotaria socialis]
MEEDLENQLKELEREEEEEYLLLERSLEEQLKQEESNTDINEFEVDYVKQLEYIEILQKFQQNEQQQYCDTLMQELNKYENLVKQFKNLFKNQYQSKQKLCLTPGNDSEFRIRQRKNDHHSIMEWLFVQIITMFYNSTGITYFDIPISANETYHMQLNDTIRLYDLAKMIKALKISYRGDLTTASPMKIEKECTNNNYKIYTTTHTEQLYYKLICFRLSFIFKIQMMTTYNNKTKSIQNLCNFTNSEQYGNIEQQVQAQNSTYSKPMEENIRLKELNQSSTMKNIQEEIKKIPQYLTLENKSFQIVIDQALSMIITMKTRNNQRKKLQDIALLVHKMKLILMYRRLWTIYLKSGMGQLINQSKIQCNYPVDVKIWPEEVKNILSSREINKKNEHKICSQFVKCYLRKFNDQLEQYHMKWHKETDHFHGYTYQILQLFENYMKQYLRPLCLKIEHKIEVLHYDYHIQAIKHEYNRHNPNEYQKNIMKQLCQNSSILQSTSIHSIENSLIRKHLFNQYKDIVTQSKSFFLNVRMTSAEEQQDKYKEIHDLEIKRMWLDRHIMNHQEKLPLIMIDLINERCHKIHECIQCIYKFKIQSFLSSSI